MVRKSIVLLVLALMIALTGTGAVSAQDEAQASVYVVHGIPGADLGLDPALPVDVSVGETCALQGFTFGEIAGPVALPAGEYAIAIRLANAENPCGSEPVLEANVPFEAGENASVVAYLDTEGAPTAGKFTNDLDDIDDNRLRVIAHHTANAPAVDIRFIRQEKLNDKYTLARRLLDVTNGVQGSADLRPGTWDISFRPSADRRPENQIGPYTLPLEEDAVYLAFAVGSLENETFTVLTKQIQE